MIHPDRLQSLEFTRALLTCEINVIRLERLVDEVFSSRWIPCDGGGHGDSSKLAGQPARAGLVLVISTKGKPSLSGKEDAKDRQSCAPAEAIDSSVGAFEFSCGSLTDSAETEDAQ